MIEKRWHFNLIFDSDERRQVRAGKHISGISFTLNSNWYKYFSSTILMFLTFEV